MVFKTLTEFNQVLREQAVKNSVPITGQFELTARCNLRCKMCYVCRSANDSEVRGQELTARQWIRLAEEARDAGMLYVLLTGGEVFLRPDFKSIYEEMLNLGLRLSIYTNATLITPKIAEWLGRMRPEEVEITVYGASSDTYQRVTGNARGFELAWRGIDLLREQGIEIKLRTTVIRDNADDLERISELANARDLMLRYVFYVSARRGESSKVDEAIRLTPYEIHQCETRCSQAYGEYMDRMKSKHNIAVDPVPDQPDHEKLSSDSAFACHAGTTDFWVTWQGEMTPCGLMSEPATRPLQTGFATAWQELGALCRSIPICSDCQKCDLNSVCSTCPARLKSETGSYDVPAQYLCEWARYRKSNF